MCCEAIDTSHNYLWCNYKLTALAIFPGYVHHDIQLFHLFQLHPGFTKPKRFCSDENHSPNRDARSLLSRTLIIILYASHSAPYDRLNMSFRFRQTWFLTMPPSFTSYVSSSKTLSLPGSALCWVMVLSRLRPKPSLYENVQKVIHF